MCPMGVGNQGIGQQKKYNSMQVIVKVLTFPWDGWSMHNYNILKIYNYIS